MPVSLVFALANVDEERLFNLLQDKPRFDALIDAAAKEGYAMAAWYSFDHTTIPGVVSVNNGAWRDSGKIDGTCLQPAHPRRAYGASRSRSISSGGRARSTFRGWRIAT